MSETLKFKEGCVTIEFNPSKGKQCVTIIIDFGEADIDPSKAASLITEITDILRKGLNLKLSDFQ